jgi:hypothetical protein
MQRRFLEVLAMTPTVSFVIFTAGILALAPPAQAGAKTTSLNLIEHATSDSGWCIRTVAGKSWECFWTLTLADGQITVEGPFLDAGDSVVAVTGGTGKYAGVRGEMALHARDAKGSAYDFKYSLIK